MTTVATLLVIDDDADVLALVSDVAEALEFRVVARRDNGAALAEVAAIKPDAAVADLSHFDAATMLRELGFADPQRPVILMSRNAT